MNPIINCPCCGHSLYTFLGYYDLSLAQIRWNDWYRKMKPHRIEINTLARYTWLYLFAPDPSAPAFPPVTGRRCPRRSYKKYMSSN